MLTERETQRAVRARADELLLLLAMLPSTAEASQDAHHLHNDLQNERRGV
jgi:hypothetical protein